MEETKKKEKTAILEDSKKYSSIYIFIKSIITNG